MPSKRRRRREQPGDTPLDRRGRPVAPWKWLTFPVYFAAATGLFLGFNLGLLANSLPQLNQIGGLAVAILFSFGLAQLATRPFVELLLRRRARQQRRPGSSQG
jgi:hypothetical protein